MYFKTSSTRPSRRTFYCPACDTSHSFNVEGWTLIDTAKGPTVSPSLKITGYITTRAGESEEVHCHLFIREGKLVYLPDYKHDMAGETVPMVSYEG